MICNCCKKESNCNNGLCGPCIKKDKLCCYTRQKNNEERINSFQELTSSTYKELHNYESVNTTNSVCTEDITSINSFVETSSAEPLTYQLSTHNKYKKYAETVLIGCKGPMGDPGRKGERGDPGPPGKQGPRGDRGLAGPKGPKGYQGDIGPTGPPGITGPCGPPGPTGCRGPQGPQGEQGPNGPRGITGPAGPTGCKGPQGDVGPDGPAGSRGPQGLIGDKGPRGDPGDKGPRGDTGCRGPEGPKGKQGDMGRPGPPGACKCNIVLKELLDYLFKTNAINDNMYGHFVKKIC